jgi:hypothetical protein
MPVAGSALNAMAAKAKRLAAHQVHFLHRFPSFIEVTQPNGCASSRGRFKWIKPKQIQ